MFRAENQRHQAAIWERKFSNEVYLKKFIYLAEWFHEQPHKWDQRENSSTGPFKTFAISYHSEKPQRENERKTSKFQDSEVIKTLDQQRYDAIPKCNSQQLIQSINAKEFLNFAIRNLSQWNLHKNQRQQKKFNRRHRRFIHWPSPGLDALLVQIYEIVGISRMNFLLLAQSRHALSRNNSYSPHSHRRATQFHKLLNHHILEIPA